MGSSGGSTGRVTLSIVPWHHAAMVWKASGVVLLVVLLLVALVVGAAFYFSTLLTTVTDPNARESEVFERAVITKLPTRGRSVDGAPTREWTFKGVMRAVPLP